MGSPFTWCNNRDGHERIWQRVDKVMFNWRFKDVPNYNVSHLTCICSDHTPLWFQFQVDNIKKPCGFIFQTMWADHPYFIQLVSDSWETPVQGSPGQKAYSPPTYLKTIELECISEYTPEKSYSKRACLDPRKSSEPSMVGSCASGVGGM